MKVLVDTHTFFWDLLSDHRSSRLAKQVLKSDEHELYFSLVSLWEFSIKIKTGKLNALGSSVSYLRDEMENYSMQLLPIRYEHVLALETLPAHHSEAPSTVSSSPRPSPSRSPSSPTTPYSPPIPSRCSGR